jgi:diguanylate cyclase (GGDEF)-like protein
MNLTDRGPLSPDFLRVKTDLQSTFIGTPLDFAQHCYDQFNAESSVKGVLRRLVIILRDWFGVEQVAYLTLDTVRQTAAGRDFVSRFQSMGSPSDDQILAARLALQPALVGDDEVRCGCFALQIHGLELQCAQFDEPSSARGVLVWVANHRQNYDRPVLLMPDAGMPKNQILDFIVRSAQQVTTWLRRLDNAQSLLYQDEVTGLYNYRYLDVAIESELRRYQRFQAPFSLLFIDLDNFKQVNDLYGHLTGSSVLRQVGMEIKAAVRDIDSVLRYGGDEFVVVLIGANSRQAAAAAERVRSRVDGGQFRVEGSDKTIHVTTSIGVACCPDHGRDKATIIQVADETMYRAKNDGKNRVIMPRQSEHSDHITSINHHGRQP